MTIVSASTIIAAPRSKVRETVSYPSPSNVSQDSNNPQFLDWPNISIWDKTYKATFTILSPDGTPDPSKTGLTVQPQDRVRATMWAGESDLEILENTPERLRWKGLWHGMLAVRTFAFEEAEGGKTRFTQSEEATGFMGGVLKADAWMGGNLRKKFVKFNEELKGFCERKE
jgi:hypothetical protein